MKGKHRWIRLIVLEHVNLRSHKDQRLPIAGHSQSENMRLTLPPSSPEQIQISDVSSVCSMLVNHMESSCTVSLMTDISTAMARKKREQHFMHFILKSFWGLSTMLNIFMASWKPNLFIYQLRLISVKFFFQGYANVYWLNNYIGTSVFKSFAHLSVAFLLILNIFEHQNKHQNINSGNTTSEYQSS